MLPTRRGVRRALRRFSRNLGDAVAGVSGLRVYRTLPRGLSLIDDIRCSLQRGRFEIVFDVGANVGQSSVRFARWFPAADIYLFEPVPESFAALRRRFARRERFHLFNCALGDHEGEAVMTAGRALSAARILAAPEVQRAGETRHRVSVTRLDTVAEMNQVGRIDFLKIDTEGYDLRVLRGAERLLDSAAIGIVQCEVGIGSGNQLHAPLEEVREWMIPRGYHLFGFYEQVPELWERAPMLRRADAVFISPRVAEENTRVRN